VKTYSQNPNDVKAEWFLLDAEGVTLGRMATRIADIVRGKLKPEFTPHVDCGDFVVVINADKVHISGSKEEDKIYSRHSGHPGGFRQENLKSLRKRRPIAIIERAVKGMLPHTTLGRHQFTKLKVYAGSEHPHAAQNPKKLELNQDR
jgi:large subunit ribosomal protein L13